MQAIVSGDKRLWEMTLKSAVMYDDFDFAARAAALLERAAIRADAAIKWDLKPWRFDVLKQSVLAKAAFAETTDADLIVVASCGTHLPPDELMDWLEQWAAHRQIKDAAVMAFCPEENAGPMSLGERLKQFAEWHGLPFLGSRILQDDGASTDFVHRLWRQRQLPQPVAPSLELSGGSARPPRHWGINE
jgi:hypothetical protein